MASLFQSQLAVLVNILLCIVKLFGKSGIFLIIFGLLSIGLSKDVATLWGHVMYYKPEMEQLTFIESNSRLIGVVLVGLAFSFASMRYLKLGDKIFSTEKLGLTYSREFDTDYDDHIKKLQKDILDIKDSVSNLSINPAIEPSEADKQRLLQAMLHKIDSALSKDFLKRIEDKYGDAIRQSENYKKVQTKHNKMCDRLLQETSNLNRRGNLNLVIGIFISLIGIVFLGTIVVNAPALQSNKADFVAYYIPKTSFVILVELFAFFFLNLYRMSLNEIKYFHNELTNVESHMLAVETALLSGENNLLSSIVKQLGETERNFVLNKGQTTVELEKEKQAGSAMLTTLDKLVEICTNRGKGN